MSSPKMTRMFGLGVCCARAGVSTRAVPTTADASTNGIRSLSFISCLQSLFAERRIIQDFEDRFESDRGPTRKAGIAANIRFRSVHSKIVTALKNCGGIVTG